MLQVKARRINMRQRAKLLHGNSQDVIDANINSLKNSGYSHAHATHFALRHANKKHGAKAKKIAAKVIKKSDQVTIKSGGPNA
jgi:hypothetical protein